MYLEEHVVEKVITLKCRVARTLSELQLSQDSVLGAEPWQIAPYFSDYEFGVRRKEIFRA